MRKCRFTEKQIVALPREADRISVAAAAEKHQVSDATDYSWRKNFGQMRRTTSSIWRCWSLRTPGSRICSPSETSTLKCSRRSTQEMVSPLVGGSRSTSRVRQVCHSAARAGLSECRAEAELVLYSHRIWRGAGL